MRLESIPKHSDDRGFLVEFMREDENYLNFKGQVYCSTISPGDIRGNHYHKYKNEIFCVMKGKLKVLIQKVGSRNIEEVVLDSNKENIDRILVLPGYAHSFENIGDEETILLAYGDQVHDHDNPDQFPYIIKS
ncbi:MAG: WxcM-like domain-containing protein [Candidatus Cloacimonetes bacterium]|nr:WxcM-like domain-containing protein [Candidatus Cloacimonadota bacterium]